ncbi:5'-nucleotidase C-terminal domain-containing protein [Clostridium nigeriense]|uniref:5'-nucleotidase C-terminal domain-containing protein n=1 Tax=Clostridium nigeriense TaxID=1805470 RepID=UPI003D350445
MKKLLKRKLLSGFLAFAMMLGLITVPVKEVKAEVATYVVISEVYGGGGNGGATYKNDFIELYNPTDTDINLTGWKVQYSAKAGGFSDQNNTEINGVIKGNGYFLIQEAKGSNGNVDLPTPDVIGNIAMSGTDCKVRLIDNNGNVIDLVGIGTANEAEGNKTAKGMSNSKSVQRKDNDGKDNGITNGWDTNNNEEDFYSKEPTPRNSEYSSESVELISLKADENINLEVSEVKLLLVSYEPENTTEKDVKFESLNEEIATVDNDGNVTGIKEGETTIKVTSTAKENISAEIKITVDKAVDKKGPEITNIYPASGQNIGSLRKPEIKATIVDESGVNKDSLKLYLDGNLVISEIKDDVITYQVDKELEDGKHTIKVEIQDLLGNLAEKEWRFTVGEVTKNLYFGQLHSHTNLSDGTGTVDEAYQYAENIANVDFLAITDHSNWFDNDTKANITDGSASTKWNTGKAAADKYTKNGEFVAIYGYEMTWSGSTGGYGHINTFNTEGFETRSNSKMDLQSYYNVLKTQSQSLAQFNHPGKTFGDFSDFAYYDEAIDNVINLIEVGNGEGEIGSSGYFQSYEYYTRALDKGWHLAPTNNQDNHKGKWGNANTGRTVIEASELTRESIYDAIREKRVYATEDENLKISYEVNGNTMGSILPDTDNLNFEVNIEDIDEGDNIKNISIIGDGGKVIQSIDNVNSNNKEWKFSLDESTSSYYYVRVEQVDKDIAVTAPVWVGEKENFGISTVDKDRDVILSGETFNINTNIYNNEGNSVNNIKVEYFKNAEEESFKSDTIESIEAGKTFTAELPYSFDKPGDYSFTVKVSATINGVLKEFKSSITIEVLGENEVSKVVIDGSHQNQYVTGDYKDKITTLTALMGQNNIKAIINTEKLTDKVLEGASLLILSDPQSVEKNDYGLSPQKYSEDELDAIARFAKNGGNIIITSKADYGDAKDDYGNAAQGNAVLNAIGSKIRFNDDQATDDVNNGGQSYRLYFNNYNTENSWLTGIDTSKNYSFYSGSTLIIPQDMSNIDVLVKGHETTYGNDADNQGDNEVVEKGDVAALAVETLSNGTKVFVSGATFFSNFEMDGLDYSNYQITEKLIKELAPLPEIPVSKIEDARIDADNNNIPDKFGETVVVEGYVTSASNTAAPGNSFFDVIYIQDDTAGLTVFGVSGLDIKLGQKVRIKGKVSSYLNDAQISIKNENTDVKIIDENIKLKAPIKLSTNDSMLEEKEGLLVSVEGKVTRIEGQNIFVDDGSGESRVYVEGYVRSSENPGVNDEWKSRVSVGDTISAIGLASEDPEGHRLRVRDSAEIVLLNDKDLEITLFHTNDSHGRVIKDSSIIGIDVISAIKKSTANSLLLDAGDTLHGLPFATLNKGEDIVSLMKLAGYDAMAPGNHDFNYGYERLLELRDIAAQGDNEFSIISSNVMKGNESLLDSNIIKEVQGVKIGIFGLSTPETAYKTNPNNVIGIDFTDPVESAKKQVEELKKNGADIIVALAHIGIDESSEVVSTMVADQVDGIDVIIDGHSHSELSEGITTENGTLIASTGEYENNLGKVVLTIDKDSNKIVNKVASLISKSETTEIQADEAVTNKITEINNEQSDILSKVVGNSKVHLEGSREFSRTQETNLGNLITDAMLNETGAEIAITNGGGIRDSIDEGEITKGEIIKVLPFGNYIVTKALTGAQIKEVLEHGVKAYPSTAGHFPQVAGINFVFDETKEAGSRIVGITINGKPIEMDKIYVVATNDFMAAGGDEYPHFANVPTINEYKSLEEALETYINKLGDIDYSIQGRIKVAKNTAPNIVANDVIINVSDKFDPLKDVTAIDNEDGDITSWIKLIENTVDLEKAGEYKLVYEVADSQNEVTRLEVKVTVKESQEIEKPDDNKPGEIKPDTSNPSDDKTEESKQESGNNDKLPATGGNNPIYLFLISMIIIGAGTNLAVKRKNKEVINK